MNRIDEALQQGSLRLEQSRLARNDQSYTPRLDAEVLLCHVLNKNASHLFTWPEKKLSPEQAGQFSQLIEKRVRGIPIAYLIGYKEFWTLRLLVNPDVLIPRPDTELIVEVALERDMPTTAKVADLGTGTGAIALALASEHLSWQITGVDLYPEPVHIARENAKLNNIHNVEFIQGNWCAPLAPGFDMIISNPPYICEHDHHLNQGDVTFEPRTALTAGLDGLDDIRRLSRQSMHTLVAGGWLLLEHGYEQGEVIRSILAHDGYLAVETRQDLAGHDRVTLAQKPSDHG